VAWQIRVEKRTTRHPEGSATKPLRGAQKDHRGARHRLTVVIIITRCSSSCIVITGDRHRPATTGCAKQRQHLHP
jgi:hypothetical protein